MENEAQKSAGKVWLIPTIVAAVLLIGLIVFMVIMGKGTSAVADGTVTLAESVAPLKDGTAQLSDGVDQYTEGVDTIHKAMPTLEDGVKQYTEGVDTLNGYMKELNGAAPTLASGVKQLADGSVTLKNGTATLASSVGDLKAQAYGNADAIAAANQIFKAYSEGGNDAATAAIQELLEPYATANQAGAIVVMVNTSRSGIADKIKGLKQVRAAISAYEEKPSFATAKQAMGALNQEGLLNAEQQAAYNALTADNYSTLAAQLGPQIAGAGVMIDGSIQALTQMDAELAETLATYAPVAEAKRNEAVGVLTKVVTALCGYAGTANNIDALLKGCNDLDAGAKQLSDGLATLNSSVNGKDGLVSSVSKLYKEGSNKLAENSDALRDGVKQLADGAKKLSENSDALRDGASQLKDAAPALIDGIQQLVDGAKQVKGFVPGNK